MKKAVLSGLVIILMLPLFVIGCTQEEPKTQPTPSNVPALNGGEEAKTIEISTDEFAAQKDIVRNIEITYPGSLIVSLGSNPTTGFQWDEEVAIAQLIKGEPIIEQASHNYVEPQEGEEPVVGAPGKDVWVFDSKAKGTTTLKFTYSRPWEGGEKGEWTLRLDVTIK
jgi:predicted secreted protein